MSIHKRYKVDNKTSIKQWLIVVIVCMLLTFFLMLVPSLARYSTDWSGIINTTVAKWQIKINGVALSGDTLTNMQVDLIPDTNIIPDYPEKIKPGQNGHFDIQIDPTGTEVSFSYVITLDLANRPNGMSIDGYSVITQGNVGEKSPLQDGNKILGDIALPTNGIFKEENCVTIRFYWNWADDQTNEGFDDLGEYTIVVTTTIQQYY